MFLKDWKTNTFLHFYSVPDLLPFIAMIGRQFWFHFACALDAKSNCWIILVKIDLRLEDSFGWIMWSPFVARSQRLLNVVRHFCHWRHHIPRQRHNCWFCGKFYHCIAYFGWLFACIPCCVSRVKPVRLGVVFWAYSSCSWKYLSGTPTINWLVVLPGFMTK